MQAVSLGWSCPSSPGSRRVLMGQLSAGALSRPARRRPELTARAAAPVRAPASSSAGQGQFYAGRTSARLGRSARRADQRMAGALIQSRQVPG